MYDAKTETFGNINISPQKSAFVESLKAEFSVSENGLAIVLADNDYLNCSNRWRNEGLHMNLEKGDTGNSSSLRFADDLMLKGEYYRAITEYYRFNAYNPNDIRVVSNNFKIAQCMELSNRFDEAIQEYNYIVEKHPKSRITALQKLSEVQNKNGHYENSNETIRKLELLDKVHSDAISLTRGVNYIHLQNYQAAFLARFCLVVAIYKLA